ncbi:hypothetical protein ACVWZR_002136 [Bradyrhizobium sp. i1.3.1]
MRLTQHRLKPACQRLIGKQRVEIHRDFRHPNAMPLGRDRRVQVGERCLVIEPAAFRHKALNELQHTVGPVDEATQHLARIRSRAAMAALVQETLCHSCTLCRRQIKEGQVVARFIMAAGLLELRFPLRIHQGGCDIRECVGRIAPCRMPLRLDENRPARSETPECIVQPACDRNKLSRHGTVEVRSPEPRRPLK